MSKEHRFAAVDLGASSGRVMVGRVTPDTLTLHEAHRFPNEPVRLNGTLHWNILSLHQGVLTGLKAAATATTEATPLTSIGIDSWAVDYGLLDATGSLLGNPVHYRDTRTADAADTVAAAIPPRPSTRRRASSTSPSTRSTSSSPPAAPPPWPPPTACSSSPISSRTG